MNPFAARGAMMAALAFLISGGSTAAAQPGAQDLTEARRIVFLGDSITYGGEYVEYLEAWFRCTYPAANTDFLNLGLPSETVSGLSEPGHAGGAFPRPDLHERLERILTKAKPSLVVACYGMNDGIYHPYSEQRAAAFQNGIRRLREKVEAVGSRMIHLT